MGIARSFVAVFVIAVAPIVAHAESFDQETEASPAPSGPAASPPVSSPPPVTAPPAQARPAVRFVGALGLDFGFTDLLKVKMSDGSSQSLAANQGFFFSLGAAFLPLLDGRLETQATLGVKGWSIDASNGSASIVTFPLEVLEVVHVDPLRFGAGVVYLHRPTLSGKGVLDPVDTSFESSLGVVAEAEWTVRTSRTAVLGFGPRYIWQELRVRDGGPVVDASAIGFVMSLTAG